MQQITANRLELAYIDQGHTGEATQDPSTAYGIQLEAAKHTGPSATSFCCIADGRSTGTGG
jgi:hypothetical protein